MMRKVLIALAILMLISVGLKKLKSEREAEWQGLSEDEARAKLDAKLPAHIPDDKRSAISDKVIAKMLDRGVIGADSDVDDEAPLTPQAVAAAEG